MGGRGLMGGVGLWEEGVYGRGLMRGGGLWKEVAYWRGRMGGNGHVDGWEGS